MLLLPEHLLDLLDVFVLLIVVILDKLYFLLSLAKLHFS